MKLAFRLFLLGFFILVLQPTCSAAPKLFMPHRSFTFDPVPDGTVINHDYIIQNHGDEPLEILEIGTS